VKIGYDYFAIISYLYFILVNSSKKAPWEGALLRGFFRKGEGEHFFALFVVIII
jgi:hypothetical protein